MPGPGTEPCLPPAWKEAAAAHGLLTPRDMLLVKAFRVSQGPGGFVIVRTVSAKRPGELENARKMPKPGHQC